MFVFFNVFYLLLVFMLLAHLGEINAGFLSRNRIVFKKKNFWFHWKIMGRKETKNKNKI